MNRNNTTSSSINDNPQWKLGEFIRELLAHVSITYDGKSGAFHIDITPVNNIVEPSKSAAVIDVPDNSNRIEQKKSAGNSRNKSSNANSKNSIPPKRKS